MKSLLFLLIFTLGSLTATAARAEAVHGLYEATVPVADQSRDLREQALVSAFRQVLIKVSGYSGVVEDPAVIDALDKVDRYVRQFRYDQRTPTENDSAPLSFWARFDRAGVEELLRHNDLPVWGNARPVTLVWLAVEEQGQRHLIGTGEPSDYSRAIERQADRRGVPFRLPLLDLTDHTQLTASDVWGDFRSTVLAASKRYEAQAVVVGRIYHAAGGDWQAHWSLYQGSDAVHWDNSGPELAQLLGAAVDASVDTISLRYTRTYGQGDGSVMNLRVNNVTNLDDYSQLLHYLQGVTGVASVEVTELAPDFARFRLTLDGARENVSQAIGLGNTLTPDTTPKDDTPALSGVENTFVYRLLK